VPAVRKKEEGENVRSHNRGGKKEKKVTKGDYLIVLISVAPHRKKKGKKKKEKGEKGRRCNSWILPRPNRSGQGKGKGKEKKKKRETRTGQGDR